MCLLSFDFSSRDIGQIMMRHFRPQIVVDVGRSLSWSTYLLRVLRLRVTLVLEDFEACSWAL